jgi:hypothetical protein
VIAQIAASGFRSTGGHRWNAPDRHFTPGERWELLYVLVDEVRVYPGRIEVALCDGNYASAPLEQAARKARGPKSGGGKAVGAVHTDQGEVHAPQ